MSRFAVVPVLLAALALGPAAGNTAYRDGRFADSVDEYRRALARGADSALLRYNLGTALLALGDHAEAREQLDHAAAEADGRIAQPAHYNAGNADLEPSFRAGASPARAEALRRAIERYRQALILDGGDQDAKWNLELAQRLLAQQEPAADGEDEPEPAGAAGAEDAAAARPDPQPAPDDAGRAAGMSRAEAERLLGTAAERDGELQQQKLRRAERPPPHVRDW